MTNDFITRQMSFMGVSFPVTLSANEQIISVELEKTAVWEPGQLVLYPQLVQSGGTFIDVGANVGINSIFMAHIVADVKVYAVEASKANYQLLKNNSNDVDIKLFNIAIADKNGFLDFSGEGTNAQIASASHPSTDTVACQTLDSFVSENNITEIDLIKIDVEGYTDVVIGGSEKSLSIIKNAIVEFSIDQTLNRYEQSGFDAVSRIFGEQIDYFKNSMPYTYYISRNDGLIEFSDVRQLISMVSMEHSVGDILFSKSPLPNSGKVIDFCLSRVADLMRQNHYRLSENANLSARNEELQSSINELKRENHYRIEEVVRLESLINQTSVEEDDLL